MSYDELKMNNVKEGTPQVACPPTAPLPKAGQIHYQGCRGGTRTVTGVMGSNDVDEDMMLAWRVWEFKGAAQRQGKVLIVDFVPKWKAWICKNILRMEFVP